MKEQTASSSFIRRRRQTEKPKIVKKSKTVLSVKPIEIDASQTIGPRIIRAVSRSEVTLFLSLLTFRLINALLIQTSFVPDEHWQSVEVAHRMAFGYGYLTWEWKLAIRSPLFPMCFALMFKIFAICGIDSRLLITKSPRFVMGLLAAVADLSLYRFSHRLGGQAVAQLTLACQLLNWFTLFAAARTLINSLEWALTTLALAHFTALPAPQEAAALRARHEWRFLLIVSVCVLLRPTAAVQWLPLCLWHIYIGFRTGRIRRVLFLYIAVGLFSLGLSALVEKHFYGRWTLSQVNFLYFNVIADVAKFYGTHSWHWYWTQGWPVLLGVQLPLFILACARFRNDTSSRLLIFVIIWSIHIYSFSAHKEFRFLFPLLPLALHLCGGALAQFSAQWQRRVLLLVLLFHLPAALYTNLVHQRAGLDVMSALGRQIERGNRSGGGGDGYPVPRSLLFLTPCHATPYYAHLHFNISLRFLTCEPNLNNAASYVEEQEAFFANPAEWMRTEFPQAHTRPDRLVLYERLLSASAEFETRVLRPWRYRLCGSFFHSHFAESGSRHGRYMLMFCKL